MHLFSLSSYLYGLVSPFVLVAIILFLARQWRAVWHWYIGLRLTRWWAMALMVFAMKHLPVGTFHTMRGQGRLWISPKNHFFEDKSTVK